MIFEWTLLLFLKYPILYLLHTYLSTPRSSCSKCSRLWGWTPSSLDTARRAELYRYSEQMAVLDMFISHTWQTAGWRKFLSLLVQSGWRSLAVPTEWLSCVSSMKTQFVCRNGPSQRLRLHVGFLGDGYSSVLSVVRVGDFAFILHLKCFSDWISRFSSHGMLGLTFRRSFINCRAFAAHMPPLEKSLLLRRRGMHFSDRRRAHAEGYLQYWRLPGSVCKLAGALECAIFFKIMVHI